MFTKLSPHNFVFFCFLLSFLSPIKNGLTNAGSIVALGLFSIQLTRSDNLDHLDLAISKESKRTESTCCAVSGKAFGKETVPAASVPVKPIALSSAVCMIIDQRALGNGTVGHNNDSPTYMILHNPPSTSSEVSCWEKSNPPSSMVVHNIDKRGKGSNYL